MFGSDFVSYLRLFEDLPKEIPAASYAVAMARRCREFICEAPDDGWPMLHFLSSIVREASPSSPDHRLGAEAWVREQIRVHARNEKLLRRYVRLAKYFDSYPWH